MNGGEPVNSAHGDRRHAAPAGGAAARPFRREGQLQPRLTCGRSRSGHLDRRISGTSSGQRSLVQARRLVADEWCRIAPEIAPTHKRAARRPGMSRQDRRGPPRPAHRWSASASDRLRGGTAIEGSGEMGLSRAMASRRSELTLASIWKEPKRPGRGLRGSDDKPYRFSDGIPTTYQDQ